MIFTEQLFFKPKPTKRVTFFQELYYCINSLCHPAHSSHDVIPLPPTPFSAQSNESFCGSDDVSLEDTASFENLDESHADPNM